jgi:NADH:ubiquinone oxidoreductase subunit F (NADH-binding)/NAD-dependent dihydropyrimidine dehydrogenase PreA subunit
VPLILKNGAAWHAGIGTAKSKGTMIFSLTGKVNNTGLVEVPMGITLRELVFDIGGGIPGNKAIKAVQTGGPAGGCIPEKLLDLPLDFEKLTEAGSMMGSGGMIVMDESTCMVDVARYFLSFTQEESCGKCTPCREGGRQMLAVLNNITQGLGSEDDLDLLAELAETMQEGSLCALGRLAPNPVLTTLRYFRDEYSAHVLDKKCPAGTCRALIKYLIDPEACNGCGRCLKACAAGAVTGVLKEPHAIDAELCTRCGACLEECRHGAILVE